MMDHHSRLIDMSSVSGMNLQQVAQPRSSSNGYGRRRTERGPEHKLQSGKTNLRRPTNAGVQAGNKGSGYGSLSRERLVYLTTCLIGHNVEVQVKDGSLISGIFHATNAEKDFGIILKMASEIRSGPSRGKKSISDFVSKAPSKTLIIPAEELVQITAKDVSVTRNGVTNDLQLVKQQDILIDSSISQSRHVDGERALERWVPDEDDPECPELESIFDGPWNRGWDQFEVNETLFGVKSTFDEELYTTKLDRGPQMRDLEREASRLAREIEGEDTQNLHLAEERGIQLHGSLDIDEETRFSSVLRGVDDSGSFTDLTSGKSNDGAQVSYGSASMDEVQSSLSSTARDLQPSSSSDYSGQPSSEFLPQSRVLDSESRIQEHRFSGQHAGSTYVKDFVDKQMASEALTSIT
ncbi:hypothetical protein RHSIM_Rhsim12G0208900 [Rhododendron simsii]|uniref:LsmAD domain-containing protein n=1 Tax=Rhododendron simsii TaxID=118357 RepID=A0A834G2N5_RHOSS|nr:hypothetical protein RHSIM_Rhsim12G0208900 [Rhododendron simsii]